jgi:two-component system, NtrC family, sensor kinase
MIESMPGQQDNHLQIQELEKTIRVLQKKLERSERERGQIESDIATKESLLKQEKQSQDLQQALEKMQAMQLQLIQSEKMSALGQTIAGIAHEINNPISFIHGNLAHLQTYTQDVLKLISLYSHHFPSPPAEISQEREHIDMALIEDDLPKILQSMNTGSQRIRDIVLALRNFSRLDEVGYKAVDLHEGIDNTLMILQQKMAGMQVIKEYGAIPLVSCVAGDINQVLMSILSNAAEAIAQREAKKIAAQPYTGIISIRTEEQSSQEVIIRIADNGIGIPPQIIDRAFDPFFTTKEIGKGTGLGLAIAWQIIVEKHGGSLDIQSKVGEGTELLIRLPSQS